MTASLAGDRYVVISADVHCGASMDTYREYLETRWHEEYDEWRANFLVPWADLEDTESDDYRRNFDSSLRQRELEGDGIVGEVLFPNTIPPFFTSSALIENVPSGAEALEKSWAGLHAHNRWLADFCSELPGRRAGIAQVWVHDVERALAEIRWAKDAGLFGGILLGLSAPGSGFSPLQSPEYEPLWALCEDLDVPMTIHGGAGMPDDGSDEVGRAVMFTTGGFFALKPLIQLIFSGVFDRHPRLRLAITETGNLWVSNTLRNLDWLVDRARSMPASQEARIPGPALLKLALKPSEYWARNCWHGASFMNPGLSEARHDEGVDKIMWGSDYPHYEGTFPHTRLSLRWTFQGIDPGEVQQMLAANAATMYGFDLGRLVPLARQIGPTVGELAGPMDAADIPPEAWTQALDADPRPVSQGIGPA
jgi:predicted TIM-barrel fold metal-dependent hydrolase